METTLTKKRLHAESILNRYYDLPPIEESFSNRTLTLSNPSDAEKHTFQLIQGHSFVLMLAYTIHRTLTKAWKPLGISVEDALAQLSTLCAVNCGGQIFIPIPSEESQQFLDALKLKLPSRLL